MDRHVSDWERHILDAFLMDLGLMGVGPVDALVSGLESPPARPPAASRDALLSAARLEGRFERFVEGVARILDVDAAEAARLLDGIHEPTNWHGSPLPDVTLHDLDGGPSVQNAIRGFVRMPGGAVFPEHEHGGGETLLVLQGSFEDTLGSVHHPGEVAEMAAATSHGFRVRPGPDLVYLFVAQTGITLGGQFFGPDDSRV